MNYYLGIDYTNVLGLQSIRSVKWLADEKLLQTIIW